MAEQKLTKHQQEVLEAIKRLGDVWFNSYELPYWIHRREHTCWLLADRGILQRRWTASSTDPVYCLLPVSLPTEAELATAPLEETHGGAS